MAIQRPDLSRVAPDVRAYIEALEAELEHLKRGRRPKEVEPEPELPTAPLVPSEPPTTLNVITITAAGIAKRTPRHLYTRQRRGGMGIFDLETGEDDPPAILTIADEGQSLILFTNLARAFRIPVRQIVETPIHARGQSIIGRLQLQPDECLAAALPDQAKGSIAMLSQRGMVRILRHHVFGEYMKPGTNMFDPKQFGPLTAACWTPGDGELFIVTRQGQGIRFSISEKLVPPAGGPGIRVSDGDEAVGVAAIYAESGVFMIDTDGRGTIRLMEGFAANKSAGGSGKIAMNSDELVAAATVAENDDIFAISHLGKIIRFMAADVPPKEGVVQGVNCMTLRGDQVVAIAIGHPV